MGMGFIARDYFGHMLVSFCTSKPHILDSEIAEAVSAWKMIELFLPWAITLFCLRGIL
jgi:hypothetical protein